MKKLFIFVLFAGVLVAPVTFAEEPAAITEKIEKAQPEFLREFRVRQLENRQRVQKAVNKDWKRNDAMPLKLRAAYRHLSTVHTVATKRLARMNENDLATDTATEYLALADESLGYAKTQLGYDANFAAKEALVRARTQLHLAIAEMKQSIQAEK